MSCKLNCSRSIAFNEASRNVAEAVATPNPTETAPERRRKFRVIDGGKD